MIIHVENWSKATFIGLCTLNITLLSETLVMSVVVPLKFTGVYSAALCFTVVLGVVPIPGTNSTLGTDAILITNEPLC